jgi:hypothetical protein
MSINALAPLLHPSERRLPSLRRLGLRSVDVTTSGALDVDEKAVSEKLQRVRWTKEIMLGRTRYIDVIWE